MIPEFKQPVEAVSVAPCARRPEILAPAGNEEMMRAAVENGADAIYFGVEEFNARLRADNFRATDLPRVMEWLHERGVRGYVTLNTLVFCGELDTAAALLAACSDAGVDAVLVQDLGVAALAARLVPDLPIHASTQTTLTSAEGIAMAQELGMRIERVVAARELSVKELRLLRRNAPCEVEAFIHGALCVAYSGQCLTSEALGGRSANRGECAQACRLPYDLIVDGGFRDTGDEKYVLSPKDLAAYGDIAKLTEAGIAAFKIEGRLKSPMYVAATVQAYRRAVDEAWGRLAPGVDAPALEMDEQTRQSLEMTFSRGFTGGYLHDINHQEVVEGRFPKKRGLYLGRVAAVDGRGVTVRLEEPLKPGDGVVFDAGRPEEDEEGGRVYELWKGGDRIPRFEPSVGRARGIAVTLAFGSGRVNLRRVRPGDRVWKTSDPEIDRALCASYTEGRVHFRRPVWATVSGAPGAPLQLRLRDEDGVSVEIADVLPAESAEKHPIDRDTLWAQLSRLGGTPVELAGMDVAIKGQVMVPFSRLNEVRRRAVEALLAARRARRGGRVTNRGALAEMRAGTADGMTESALGSVDMEKDHGRDAHATTVAVLPQDAGNCDMTALHGTGDDQGAATIRGDGDGCSTGVPPVAFESASAAGIHIRRGANLPHWTTDPATYFVTFRLADSLPQGKLVELRAQRNSLVVEARAAGLTSADEINDHVARELSQRIGAFLDGGAGECWLREPAVANMVCGGLRHFDGERYGLWAWCVMPNHVHAVLSPTPGNDIADILHRIKSFTAHKANKLLGRSGDFWQAESYDHLVRSRRDFERIVEYVLDNPVKAGLREWRWVGAVDGMTGSATDAVAVERGHGRDAHATTVEALPQEGGECDTAVLPREGDNCDTPRPSLPALSVLCRSLGQVEAAVAATAAPGGCVAAIYTDFEDVRTHREARRLVPAGGPRFVPATLRVMKPGEAGIVRKLLEAQPDALLVRNLGAWRVLRDAAPGLELLGDYSLNVANDITARILMERGLRRLTPSYDLNMDQLLDLLRAAPPEWFEVSIHQHLPMFHMEHCVFCRFLSTGTDWTNCGRPCETHSLALRDRMGYEHPVKADAGCRNTVYNAVAQSGSEYLGAMLAAGVRHFRIEFLNEDARAVREAVARYLPVIRGEVNGRSLWRELRAVSKLGVTRGSLDHE